MEFGDHTDEDAACETVRAEAALRDPHLQDRARRRRHGRPGAVYRAVREESCLGCRTSSDQRDGGNAIATPRRRRCGPPRHGAGTSGNLPAPGDTLGDKDGCDTAAGPPNVCSRGKAAARDHERGGDGPKQEAAHRTCGSGGIAGSKVRCGSRRGRRRGPPRTGWYPSGGARVHAAHGRSAPWRRHPTCDNPARGEVRCVWLWGGEAGGCRDAAARGARSHGTEFGIEARRSYQEPPQKVLIGLITRHRREPFTEDAVSNLPVQPCGNSADTAPGSGLCG
mmetsp:Transcript_112573/g.317966  ORF Transcript_112573/g.317966 Transcript_112573/m.317966 type:complete len:280 (-) Transcript_112573:19-858(-)